MSDLDAMWNGPKDNEWPTFGDAVTSMSKLRVLSCFNIMRHQIPPAVVSRLGELYGEELELLAQYTDLGAPVFYGPRFKNLNTPDVD